MQLFISASSWLIVLIISMSLFYSLKDWTTRRAISYLTASTYVNFLPYTRSYPFDASFPYLECLQDQLLKSTHRTVACLRWHRSLACPRRDHVPPAEHSLELGQTEGSVRCDCVSDFCCDIHANESHPNSIIHLASCSNLQVKGKTGEDLLPVPRCPNALRSYIERARSSDAEGHLHQDTTGSGISGSTEFFVCLATRCDERFLEIPQGDRQLRCRATSKLEVLSSIITVKGKLNHLSCKSPRLLYNWRGRAEPSILQASRLSSCFPDSMTAELARRCWPGAQSCYQDATLFDMSQQLALALGPVFLQA